MSMVKVYDREGNELCEINTEHFLYNNDDIGPKPTKFDINLYPYVKVDGVYYLNDGEEFFSTTTANNSASLMRIESAYQWKGSDPFNSNSIPGEWVKGITVDKMNDSKIITEDITDIDGNIVSKHVLKSIAAYHTIPNYFVGNKEKNFKSLSFDYNVKNNSDNKDHDGQYIFSKDVQYKGGDKKDTEYWSMAPQVYPVVVFDNMNSTEEADLTGPNEQPGLIDYYFKRHKITFTNNILTVDGKSTAVSDNDEVVFYIRKCGKWVSDKEVQYPGLWEINETSKIEVLDQTATGTLTMQDIEIYTTQEMTTQFTSNTEDINKLISNSSRCSKPYYKQIIHTLNTKYNLPQIIGAEWAARYNVLNKGSFFGIGDWDYKWTLLGGWTATLQKKTRFTMSTQIKNFQYIDVEGFADFKNKPGSIVIEVQEPIYESLKVKTIQEASFFRSWVPIVGSFPREVGFFKDGVSYGEGYDGKYNQQSLSVTNLYYKYLQFATNSLHNVPSTESLNFKVGWESQHPHDTFALAIVVWKNGKLIPEEQ